MNTFLFTHYAAFPWAFSLSLVPIFVALSLGDGFSARRFLALTLCTATLVLTHILVAFMAILSVAPALAWRAREGWRPRLMTPELLWGGAVLLGVMLTAFHTLPAMLARTLFDLVPAADAHYLDWRNSFTFPLITSRMFGMRWFLIQWIHAGVVMLTLLTIFLTLRSSLDKGSSLHRFVHAQAVIGLAALVLSSELAFALYYFVEPMRSVQWPYRFLSIASVVGLLGLSLSLGLVYPPERERILRRTISLALFCSLLLVAALQVQLWREGQPAKLEEGLLNQNFRQHGSEFKTRGPQWERYVSEGGMAGQCDRLGVECRSATQTGHRRVWRVDAASDTRLLLPAFDFPGWSTRLNAQELAHTTDADTGLVSIVVPKGTHTVTLDFIGLPSARTGRLASGAALLVLPLVLALLGRRTCVRLRE